LIASLSVRNPKELVEGDAARGATLFTELDCVSCHGATSAIPGIDLSNLSTRLTPGFFHDYLLDPWRFQPDTIMPKIFKDRPKAEQEIADLWEYLTH